MTDEGGRFEIIRDESLDTTIRLDTVTGKAWVFTLTTRCNDFSEYKSYWWMEVGETDPAPVNVRSEE